MALASAPTATAVIGEVIDGLSPGESRHLVALERRIERGLAIFQEVGMALLEIRDKRLFRVSHKTFESYAKERWGLERGRAYQLMGAAEVAEMLPEGPPVNEAQARELVPVLHAKPNMVAKVWAEVTKSGKPITAPLVREVAREVAGIGGPVTQAGRSPVTPITPTARLIVLILKVGEEYKAWLDTKPTPAQKRQVTAALKQMSTLR